MLQEHGPEELGHGIGVQEGDIWGQMSGPKTQGDSPRVQRGGLQRSVPKTKGAGRSPGCGSGFWSSQLSPQRSFGRSSGDRDRVRGWWGLPRPLSRPPLAPQWEENLLERNAGRQRGNPRGQTLASCRVLPGQLRTMWGDALL